MPIDLTQVAEAITVLQRMASTPAGPVAVDGDDREPAPADPPVR